MAAENNKASNFLKEHPLRAGLLGYVVLCAIISCSHAYVALAALLLQFLVGFVAIGMLIKGPAVTRKRGAGVWLASFVAGVTAFTVFGFEYKDTTVTTAPAPSITDTSATSSSEATVSPTADAAADTHSNDTAASSTSGDEQQKTQDSKQPTIKLAEGNIPLVELAAQALTVVNKETRLLNRLEPKADIPASDDEETLKAAVEAAANQDTAGMTALALQEKITLLKRGTRIKVLEIGESGFAIKVRVLSGSQILQEWWIPVYCFKPVER